MALTNTRADACTTPQPSRLVNVGAAHTARGTQDLIQPHSRYTAHTQEAHSPSAHPHAHHPRAPTHARSRARASAPPPARRHFRRARRLAPAALPRATDPSACRRRLTTPCRLCQSTPPRTHPHRPHRIPRALSAQTPRLRRHPCLDTPSRTLWRLAPHRPSASSRPRPRTPTKLPGGTTA